MDAHCPWVEHHQHQSQHETSSAAALTSSVVIDAQRDAGAAEAVVGVVGKCVRVAVERDVDAGVGAEAHLMEVWVILMGLVIKTHHVHIYNHHHHQGSVRVIGSGDCVEAMHHLVQYQ